jgi:hypothetical protein
MRSSIQKIKAKEIEITKNPHIIDLPQTIVITIKSILVRVIQDLDPRNAQVKIKKIRITVMVKKANRVSQKVKEAIVKRAN